MLCTAVRRDFVDINLDDFNICHKNLKLNLKLQRKKNKLPKILVVVHFAGNPCNLKYIKNLSKKYKFKILEDASHALGSKYDNKKLETANIVTLLFLAFILLNPLLQQRAGWLQLMIKNF